MEINAVQDTVNALALSNRGIVGVLLAQRLQPEGVLGKPFATAATVVYAQQARLVLSLRKLTCLAQDPFLGPK